MEDKWGLFQKFLITENLDISINDFLINSLIIVILGFLLELTYIYCARSISNRRSFAANFILLAFTTMVIITVVKASLALSLGLVGALSIVRFRAAIKEPEELIYLFATISLGLVLGANHRILALVSFALMILLIWIRYFLTRKSQKQNMYFTVSSPATTKVKLDEIIKIVKNNFMAVDLKRYDESTDFIEASFLIETRWAAKLQNCKEELQALDKGVKVTFIDNKHY